MRIIGLCRSFPSVDAALMASHVAQLDAIEDPAEQRKAARFVHQIMTCR